MYLKITRAWDTGDAVRHFTRNDNITIFHYSRGYYLLYYCKNVKSLAYCFTGYTCKVVEQAHSPLQR